MNYYLKMLTSEDLLSQRGKPLKRVDVYLYRYDNKIRSGVTWRCVRKTCKAKILISDNFITPGVVEHNHPKAGKMNSQKTEDDLKVKNLCFTNQSANNCNETIATEYQGSQEEKELNSNNELIHDEQFDDEKSFSDKATNTEKVSFCDKATNTEKYVRSVGVNTVESSFTSNKPRRNKLKKTRDLTDSQNNSPQENFNMFEPDESFNKKNKSFKSSTDQNLLYPSAQGSTRSDSIDSSFDYDNWDDPNDLVDHLRILLAKRDAGFIGYENEIQFIFKELREAKIIY